MKRIIRNPHKTPKWNPRNPKYLSQIASLIGQVQKTKLLKLEWKHAKKHQQIRKRKEQLHQLIIKIEKKEVLACTAVQKSLDEEKQKKKKKSETRKAELGKRLNAWESIKQNDELYRCSVMDN